MLILKLLTTTLPGIRNTHVPSTFRSSRTQVCYQIPCCSLTTLRQSENDRSNPLNNAHEQIRGYVHFKERERETEKPVYFSLTQQPHVVVVVIVVVIGGGEQHLLARAIFLVQVFVNNIILPVTLVQFDSHN